MGKQFLLIAGLVLTTVTLQAQTLGLRSPQTELRQINTDTVRIIFVEGQEQQAQRIANIVHAMARKFPIQGSDELRKIPILLQGATDVSNGYVGLGPWRSEFYLSPPQNSFQLGSLPWGELLAIHEFRHVQQRSVGRRGLSKVVSILFGEEAYSGILNLSWPNWYTEGDAVIAETALTGQGRGRLPSFLNGYREKILSGDYWPYEKARNGSYKELIPSQYPLGFLLQNYGREKYGQEFWDQVALQSAAFKGGLFYPFSESVRSRTGMTTPEFYDAAMNHYRQKWLDMDRPASKPDWQTLGATSSRYADYSYPAHDSKGTLFAVKRSFDKTAAIYKIDGDKEEKIVSLGTTTEPQFSYAVDKLCWTERRLHSRWTRVDYSAIVVYDLESKSRRTLTHKSSYFSPALSQDGKRIAALHDNDLQQFAVHILDSDDGSVIQSLPNPDNYYFSYPMWQGTTHIISAARDMQGRMALTRQSIAEGEIELLTEFSFAVIGRPGIAGDWIYFSQSTHSADQVFHMHLKTGAREQQTEGLTGKYQPSMDPSSGDLIFTEYALQGKKLKRIEQEDLGLVSERSSAENSASNDLLIVEENEGDILGDYQRSFLTTRYSHFTKPVNFHSWNLFEQDPVYGIELLSENVLQSITWRNGFSYNSNDESYGPFSELAIGVWYPEILLTYRGHRRKFQDDTQELRWYEHVLSAGLRVPFQSMSGPYTQIGSLYSGYGSLSTTGDQDVSFQFLSHQLVFANRRISARQHPMTRFGQAVRVSYAHSVDDVTANQWHVQTDWSFPSPLRNHVLWLQFDYKNESGENDLLFSDRFNYARGYNRVRSDWIYRVGVNYNMPVWYPDFGLGGIVYFKRLRANLFADYTRSSLADVASTFRSVGFELMFDLELFNVEPVTVGWRWSHLLDTDPADPTRMYRFGIFTPFERL